MLNFTLCDSLCFTRIPNGDINDIVISSQANMIATIEREKISLWDKNGSLLHILDPEIINPDYKMIQFSDDERYFGCLYKKCLLIWDVISGKLISKLEADEREEFQCFLFHPHSEEIVLGSAYIKFFNYLNGTVTHTIKDCTKYGIYSISYNKKEHKLIAGFGDGNIAIWEENLKKVFHKKLGKGIISYVRIIDEQTLVFYDESDSFIDDEYHKISIYDYECLRTKTKIVCSNRKGFFLISNDKFLLYQNKGFEYDKSINVLNMETGDKFILPVKDYLPEPIVSLSIDEDYKLITKSKSGTIFLWYLENRIWAKQLIDPEPMCFDINENRGEIAIGTFGSQVIIYDLFTFEKRKMLTVTWETGLDFNISTVLYINSDFLLVGFNHRLKHTFIKVYNLKNGKFLDYTIMLPGLSSSIYTFNNKIITVCFDNSWFDYWDIQSGSHIEKIHCQDGTMCGALNSNKNQLAIGYENGSIDIYDAEKMIRLKTINTERGKIYSMDLNADGNLAAIGTYRGEVAVYDTDKGVLVNALSDNNGWIRVVKFIKNRLIYSVSNVENANILKRLALMNLYYQVFTMTSFRVILFVNC